MSILNSFLSKPTAAIILGIPKAMPDNWVMQDIDAAYEKMEMAEIKPSVESLFNDCGLNIQPDIRSRSVGLYGEQITKSNFRSISEKYFEFGYDTVVLDKNFSIIEYRKNNKCKIELRKNER